MNWILASLIMFVSSVILYLFVRKSQLQQIPNIFNNLTMFVVPCVIFCFISLFTHASFLLSPQNFLLILFTAFVFSYLGNRFSLTSIKEAPNPGYSLIISKSYVVFTSLVSIFVFNSPLTVKDVIAIALIIIFSALIVIDKATHKTSKNSLLWLLYAFGAFFAFGFLALVSKYLLTHGVQV